MKTVFPLVGIVALVWVVVSGSAPQDPGHGLVIGWWNAENLFDTINDPDPVPEEGSDDEFTPEGRRQWTVERYDRKLEHLATVIHRMNGGTGPDLIGFAEVEHEHVLREMAARHLSDIGYDVVYHESPDRRGIDVAMMYRKDALRLLSTGCRIVTGLERPTRDIVFASFAGKAGNLVCIVNHWPSRRGGVAQSESLRVAAATVCRQLVDSLLHTDPLMDIVLLGDFNDEPANRSIAQILRASLDSTAVKTGHGALLFDCMATVMHGKEVGTYRFRDAWDMLDQCIVSPGLFDPKGYRFGAVQIVREEFMLQDSGKYAGYPFPTYGGSTYLGGYSDHLPLVVTLLGGQ